MPSPSIFVMRLDRGYKEIYNYTYPLLKTYGIYGTIYPSLDVIGSSTGMTTAQLREMQSAGWEVAYHPGPGFLTSLTEQQLRDKFDADLSRFANQGFYPKILAPVSRLSNATVELVAADYFDAQHGTLIDTKSESLPISNPYNINGIGDSLASTAGYDPQDAIAQVDWLLDTGGIVALLSHGSEDTPTDIHRISTAHLTTILDYLQPLIHDGTICNTTMSNAIDYVNTVKTVGTDKTILSSRLLGSRAATIYDGTTPHTYKLFGGSPTEIATPSKMVGYVTG